MPTKTELKAHLRQFAAQLFSELKRFDSDLFAPERRPIIDVAEEMGGWTAQLGRIEWPGLKEVVVQLDQLPGDGRYHLWVGVFCLGSARTTDLARHLRRHLGRALRLTEKQLDLTGDITQYRPPLESRYFGVPVTEVFRDGSKTFGMFLGPARASVSRAQVRLAARYLTESLSGIETWHYRTAPPPKRALNREDVVSRTAFRRNQRLAQAAKQRDRYTCQVCGARPEAVYGAEGRVCLEAHHVQALHTRKRKHTRLEDLTTVCANCHRVLGKLPPNERGLLELRAKFR